MLKNLVMSTAFMVSLVALGGCAGGNTYGTGVSQESQLAADIMGIIPLGAGTEKEQIDYSSRPGLVKAPQTAALPAPAETDQSGSGYFPTNPEDARAARAAAKQKPFTRRDGGIDYDELTDVDQPGAPVQNTADARANGDFELDREPSAAQMARYSTENNTARLKRMREVSGEGIDEGPRRYLTQPPQKYRLPAEGAPRDDLGSRERAEGEKKPLFSWGTRS